MKKQIADAIQIYLSIDEERQTTRTQNFLYVFARRVLCSSLAGKCNIYCNFEMETEFENR